MPKVHQTWKVLPHGKLTEIDDNILTVVGDLRMPLTDLPRRMTVARLTDRRLVVFSAIALDEDSMLMIDNYGQPTYLVVPSERHRMDAKIWKDRYPAMRVIAPEGARTKVEEVVRIDTSEPHFDDQNVQFMTVPGTKRMESALVVHTTNGVTLVLNDIVGNIRHAGGFGGWFLRAMHFSGDEPQVPRPVKWILIDDPFALRAQFLQWAEIPRLNRILVSHGEVIDYQPAEVLRDLAQSLVHDGPDQARSKAA